MFGLFGKNKRTVAPPRPGAIFVSQAAIETRAAPYALMQDVVDYVNAMLNDALYRREELPQEAMWLYHADYYVAQVMNGGHSQFIYNSGNQAAHDQVMRDIPQALALIGAQEMADIFDRMQRWAAENASKAALQNGFSERDVDLDVLDDAFFGLPENGFYESCNAWLRRSELLAPLDPVGLKQAFAAAADANPHYTARRRLAQIAQLQSSVTVEPLGLFKIAAAGLQSSSGPLEVSHLTAGTPMGHPTEENGIIWGVATNDGVLAGYLTEDRVVLTRAGQENGFSAGETLAECARAPAEAQVAFARQTCAAGCAAELLARVNKSQTLRSLNPIYHAMIEDKKGRPAGVAYLGITQSSQLYQFTIEPYLCAIGPYPSQEAMQTMLHGGMKRIKAEVDAHLGIDGGD